MFEKNWIVNWVLGVLFSVAETPPVTADRTGKFCRLFAPVSPSPASLGVTPLPSRSMPSRPLEKIEFPEISSVPLCRLTPFAVLNAMMFAASWLPVSVEPAWMPSVVFGSGDVPPIAVPM